MLSLGLLVAGEKGEVVGIRLKKPSGNDCGCVSKNTGLCRIEDMGIRVGRKVEILSNNGNGPLLVKVDEARIAIDRSTAMKIMVRKEN